jgi:hypothetical protein
LGGGRISVTHAEGGHQDFGQGFYLVVDPAVAGLYADRRSQQRGERGMRQVLGFELSVRDLGTIVDVRPGGPHRAQWDAFLDQPPFPALSGEKVMAGMRTTREFLAGLGVEQRGVFFDRFLESIGMRAADTIIGPLGDSTTGGISGEGETVQVSIRSQAVADQLNRLIRGEPRRRTAAEVKEDQERSGRAKLLLAAYEREAGRGTDLDRYAYPRISDEGTRRRLQTDPRFRELAYDVAHSGWRNDSTDEAFAVLHAEAAGVIPAGTTTSLDGNGDYTTGAGKPIDVFAPTGVDHGKDVMRLVKKLTLQSYDVLLDDRGITHEAVDAVIADTARELDRMGKPAEALIGRVTSIARRGPVGPPRKPTARP